MTADVIEREELKVPEGHGVIAELNKTGDTKTIWDPNKPDEVELAKDTFDRLRKKGYLIYKVKKDGEKGEAMHKFDPEAAKLIAVAPIAGG